MYVLVVDPGFREERATSALSKWTVKFHSPVSDEEVGKAREVTSLISNPTPLCLPYVPGGRQRDVVPYERQV